MRISENIVKKIETGIRISERDALDLFESSDLLSIAHLANLVNERKNRGVVYYNVNRHINPTNICVMSCKFCAYSRKPGEEGAYAYSIDEIIAKASEVIAQGATEVHMVGGLHPRWAFSHYADILRALKSNFPQLHIKAFTAVELDWMARRDRRPIRDVLEDLRNAGLGSLPGGGAEIFHPEIREQICDTKTTAEDWINIHRTAHTIGMKSNCTMLYGHIETPFHRVDHLRRLRDLQDETHGFNAFIPLSFQPHDNQMGIDRYTIGVDDLKTLAIARIYLDNFDHIKSYWIMFGQDIAQLALGFGANDLDGTVTEEKISRMAGGRAGIVMTKTEIETLIRKAQRIPVERDTLYQAIGGVSEQDILKRKNLVSPVAELLLRAINSDDLTIQEWIFLAQNAALDDLCLCADKRKRIMNVSQVVSIASCTSENILDLDTQEWNAGDFRKNWLQTLQDPNKKIGAGFEGLIRAAQQNSIRPTDLVADIKQSKIVSWTESFQSKASSMTHVEEIQIHELFHTHGIKTNACANLSSAYDGSSEPFWETFVRKLLAIEELQSSTNSVLSVRVGVTRGSYVSAHEYMRAIALARLVCRSVKHITAPIERIPTIRAALKPGSKTHDQPVMKILPLTAWCGADDLGINVDEGFDTRLVMEELQVSQLRAAQRDLNFDEHMDWQFLAPENAKRSNLIYALK